MESNRTDEARPDAIGIDSLPRWLRDIIDYNNESAGRDTGRAKRFTVSNRETAQEVRKKDEERHHFNALMRFLQDPAYAKLYYEAVDLVSRADEASERAMRRLVSESEIIAQRLERLRSAAAHLPDGRTVFLSTTGHLYAEDGEDVTEQKRSARGLSAGTASWEEYQRVKEIAEGIERRKREVEIYRHDVLDPIRLRLGDVENPPSSQELKETIERTTSKMPRDVRSDLDGFGSPVPGSQASTEKSAAEEHLGRAAMNTPDLFAKFRAASTVLAGEPYGSPPPALVATSPKNTAGI